MTGGTEMQTLSLVRALVAAGNEVVTVCYFEHDGQMAGSYLKAGSRVIFLDGDRPAGILATAVFLWKGLRKVVRKLRPDVAHVQYMAPGAIPIVILRLLGVRKIVATAHTAADIYPLLRLLHLIQRRLLVAFTCITERAERSFFGSSSLYGPETVLAKRGNHFTVYNCLPENISVTETPRRFTGTNSCAGTFEQHSEATPDTNPDASVRRPDPSIDTQDIPERRPDSLTVGVVSRLDGIKGTDLVVPAFVRVRGLAPGAGLLVVGDGPQRGLMERQAAEAGLGDCVTFAGRQQQERLQSFYDRIDILLMPSRSEGFGLTAIEGMARGCVPVVADVGGLPEVVLDGETGLLHRPEDAEDIAAKILELYGDRGRMEKMSLAAVERAALFGFDRFARLTADLYRKIERL